MGDVDQIQIDPNAQTKKVIQRRRVALLQRLKPPLGEQLSGPLAGVGGEVGKLCPDNIPNLRIGKSRSGVRYSNLCHFQLLLSKLC